MTGSAWGGVKEEDKVKKTKTELIVIYGQHIELLLDLKVMAWLYYQVKMS